MSVAYLDTSCLVAIAFAEPGHESLVARPEAWINCSRRTCSKPSCAVLRRERVGGGDELMAGLSWVLPDRAITPEIEAVLGAGSVRGGDAWHLACALYLSPDPGELEFLTLDQRQAGVAEALGFPSRI